MRNSHIISGSLIWGIGLILSISMVGCLRPQEDIQNEEPYPYKCPGVGEQELVEGPSNMPVTGPRPGIDYAVPAMSYAANIDANPVNPDQILAFKVLWDQATLSETYQAVILELTTLSETVIVEFGSDHDSDSWLSFRWGEDGWIVAEKLNDKQLYLISPDGDSPQRLTDLALGAFHNPCWVADGQEILTLGYGSDGRGSRIRTVNLEGAVQREFLLADVPPSFVGYHQFADWRADSLLVSSNANSDGDIHDLVVFSYPSMELVKRIPVIDPASQAAILHQEWWPGTERILWSSRGALYATNWLTEETETIWESCEQPIWPEFTVTADGQQVICAIGESFMREDLGIPERSIHLYSLDLTSGVISRVK